MHKPSWEKITPIRSADPEPPRIVSQLMQEALSDPPRNRRERRAQAARLRRLRDRIIEHAGAGASGQGAS